jgi:hypothetical protein
MYFGLGAVGANRAKLTAGPTEAYGPAVVYVIPDSSIEKARFFTRLHEVSLATYKVNGIGFIASQSYPSYIGPVSYKEAMVGVAPDTFSTIEATCILTGAHDVAYILGSSTDNDSAINSQATLSIFPFLKGIAGDTFATIDAVALLTEAIEIQGISNGNEAVQTATLFLSSPLPMQASASGIDCGETSNAYLFTYNFSVGNFTWAPGIAW